MRESKGRRERVGRKRGEGKGRRMTVWREVKGKRLGDGSRRETA